ncbi:MAG TPA: septal ring lytic transglycosylase RlpA family protein [Spirochaetales bacterium]|nr:septal ring lytic transglycosylase RlpA family protein [Spirochaetales bacterium]
MHFLWSFLLMVFLSTSLPGESIPLEGYASWYGGKFHGQKTASGEIFDTNLLTAAHKTLPFGTLVRVTNLYTEKSVIVRINDRGPFVEDRIIDLSKAAADAIGLTNQGIGRVKLEIVQETIPISYHTLQVASFGNVENALRLKNRLTEAGLSPSIQKTETGLHRVVIEHIPTEELEQVKSRLSELGYSQPILQKR